MDFGIIEHQIERGASLARKAGLPTDGAENWLKTTAKPWALARLVEKSIGFIRRSGFRVKQLEPGRTLCEMPLKGNTNHIGTMYAGALFTLAEVPGGALFLSSFDTQRFIPIVTEMTIKYVAPAKGDVQLEVSLSQEEIDTLQAEANDKGKATFTLDGELKSVKDGKVVATSHGVYQLRRKK